jgi:hypothetical protein
MKKLKWPLIPAIAVPVLIALVVFLMNLNLDTTLEFSVIDSVSRNFVWDLTMKLQDRYMKGYYQSNTGPILFKFRNLGTGDSELLLSAPSYTDKKVPVKIAWGANRLAAPVEMEGYEIPGLAKFFYFDKSTENEVLLELRPVDKAGQGIQNHPCLRILSGVRISEQVKDGIPVTAPTDKGSERGRQLYKGFVSLEWDPNPATFYRYSLRIPGSQIQSSRAAFWVYDFLLVIPDPRKITVDELQADKDLLWGAEDPAEFRDILDRYKGKIVYFIEDRWNKEALKR